MKKQHTDDAHVLLSLGFDDISVTGKYKGNECTKIEYYYENNTRRANRARTMGISSILSIYYRQRERKTVQFFYNKVWSDNSSCSPRRSYGHLPGGGLLDNIRYRPLKGMLWGSIVVNICVLRFRCEVRRIFLE